MSLFEFSLCGLFMLKIHSLILLSRMKQKVSVNVVFLDLFDLLVSGLKNIFTPLSQFG